MIQYILNVIIVCCALILPGMALFIKRIAAAFLILASGLFLLVQRRHQHNKNRNEQNQRIPHLLFTGIILLFLAWMFCIPKQSYLGMTSLGMGDIPEYYGLANNISSGRGFTTDYFIGDFWTGPRFNSQDLTNSPPTMARRPLIPYITSYFFYFFGQNHYIINVVASFLAALLPLSFYCFLYYHTKDTLSRQGDVFYQLFSLLVCLIPSHFILFAVGTITIFELLPLLILLLLLGIKQWKSPFSILIMALSAGLVTISRPEGLAVILIVFMIYLLYPILAAALQKRREKLLVPAVLILVGILVMNSPLLFIRYGSSSGLWYQTLNYKPQTKRFESIYPVWSAFNKEIALENFSDNPDIANILNKDVLSEIISHPVAFGKWILTEVSAKFTDFMSLYSTRNITLTHILSTILIFMMTLSLLLRPVRKIMIFLFVFVVVYSLLTPALYGRHALLMSPLLFLAFFLAFSHISTKFGFKDKALILLQKFPNKFKEQMKKPFFLRSQFIFITLCLVSLTVFETQHLISDVITHDENTKYKASIEIVKRHTEPSSIVVTDCPQLINLMTGRVTLGASCILEIMSPNMDRFRPDYVLINNCRPFLGYTRFRARRNLSANNYIAQNYDLVEHNPQKRIILFKRH